jgi:hypothetical protein
MLMKSHVRINWYTFLKFKKLEINKNSTLKWEKLM